MQSNAPSTRFFHFCSCLDGIWFDVVCSVNHLNTKCYYFKPKTFACKYVLAAWIYQQCNGHIKNVRWYLASVLITCGYVNLHLAYISPTHLHFVKIYSFSSILISFNRGLFCCWVIPLLSLYSYATSQQIFNSYHFN